MAKKITLLPSMMLKEDGTEILFDSLSLEERKEFMMQANMKMFAAIGIKARVAERKNKDADLD